jgi:phage-related protein
VAVFDWAETTLALTEEPRVAAARFGECYEERGPDGLNPVRQVWQLSFRDVEDSVATALVAFLRARVTPLGLEAFDWHPPWAGGSSIRVTCRGWTRNRQASIYTSDIEATFRQEFE